MALEMDSWAVTGAQSSARIARLQLQSGTASGNGVVAVDHLRVLPLEVPGTSVRITSGGATILGRETAHQGSYFAYNVGDAELPVSPTGSGGGRSDLVVLRVEDPNIDGTSWSHDVTTDPVYYFRVIEGVSSSTTEPPPGMTAIALARIDLPASTATVTADMIVDVRTSANPRTSTEIRIQRGVQPIDLGGNIKDYYENWPNLVWADVVIPTWATQVQMIGHWGNLFFGSADLAGGSGSTDAQGRLRIALGYGAGGGATDLVTAPTAYNFNINMTNAQRVQAMAADQLAIPPVMRGQRCNLRMQCMGADVRGRLRADEWASFYVQLLFREEATPDMGT